MCHHPTDPEGADESATGNVSTSAPYVCYRSANGSSHRRSGGRTEPMHFSRTTPTGPAVQMVNGHHRGHTAHPTPTSHTSYPLLSMKASPHLASLLFGAPAAIAGVAPSRLPDDVKALAPAAETIPVPHLAPTRVLVGSDVGEVTLPPVSPPRTAGGATRTRFPSETILVTFALRHENAHSLVSAVNEIRNEVGSRLESPHSFAREDALTRAAKALAGLQAGLTHAGYTVADQDYR